MKKLLIILILLVSCRKIEIQPTPTPNKNIFSTPQTTVSNGGEVNFELKSAGTYTLTIGDSTTNQVLTRERFMGKVGLNQLKIYTRSLPAKYLYLVLEDSTKTRIGKTTILIN